MAVTPPPSDGLDLSPRPVEAAPRTRRRRTSSAVAIGLAAVVVAALGLVVYQGIANATLYFRHVDEAIEQRAELGDRRFRLQGTVVPASAQPLGSGVAFEVTWNGQVASVRHQGDPPELFEDDIPVVLEGNWDGELFVSDRMMIRHSEEYEAANPDRVEPDAP